MKVRIYKNQQVPENPDLFVFSETGDYGPFDLIQTYQGVDPTLPFSSLQAQFIKFGGLVYREQEYVAVLAQLGLVNVQPDTLNEILTNDQSTIVVDKNPGDLPVEPVAVIVNTETPADGFATTTDPLPTEQTDITPGSVVDLTSDMHSVLPTVVLGEATTTVTTPEVASTTNEAVQ